MVSVKTVGRSQTFHKHVTTGLQQISILSNINNFHFYNTIECSKMVFTETSCQPKQYLTPPTWTLISKMKNLKSSTLFLSSIDRFLAITRPFQYRQGCIWFEKPKKKQIILVRSNVRIYLTLGGAWFIAILIGISPFFLPNTRYARAPSLLVVGQGPAFYVIYGKAMIKLFAILPKCKVLSAK